jgi:hypothetical protein
MPFRRRAQVIQTTTAESIEKRDSLRVPVAHDAEFRVTGSPEVECGRLRDLSAGGFLFSVGRVLEPGTGLSITLRSGDSEIVTAAWVVRCAPLERADGYEVACRFD